MKKRRIGVGIATILIIVGLVSGDIQIKVGSKQAQASTKTIHTQLTKLQDIS